MKGYYQTIKELNEYLYEHKLDENYDEVKKQLAIYLEDLVKISSQSEKELRNVINEFIVKLYELHLYNGNNFYESK